MLKNISILSISLIVLLYGAYFYTETVEHSYYMSHID